VADDAGSRRQLPAGGGGVGGVLGRAGLCSGSARIYLGDRLRLRDAERSSDVCGNM
jgi:hypothetical protein